VDASTAQLKQSVETLDANSLDLIAVNSLLNKAQSLSSINAASSQRSGLVIKRAGLFQGNKISEFASNKYDELLLVTLLPRLMVRLEHQMHAQNSNSEFLFEALKTYQMIGIRDRCGNDLSSTTRL